MYNFEETEHGSKLEARFWNQGGLQIAIIASITKGIDWAAYIGGDHSWTEDETLKTVAEYGCKLSAEDAKYFFPNITLPYRH